MVLKSKWLSAGAGRGSKKSTRSLMGKMQYVGVLATKKAPRRHRQVAVEPIEARLERKAVVADTKTFASESLGQMTREERHKLLYGD